jgi:quercetin dioxygenase-like cupin family protein
MNKRSAAPSTANQDVTVVAFDTVVAEVARDGALRFAPLQPGSPPRVDGHLLALTNLQQSPPHLGERHPDGDELIYLVSGEVTVVIEVPGSDGRHTLRPGDALIVPRGLWHRIEVDRPASVVHLTPGPSGEHRPASPEPTRGEPT